MTLLRWIGSIVLLVWLIGFVFKFAGLMIHWLLFVSVLVFIIDFFTSKKSKE